MTDTNRNTPDGGSTPDGNVPREQLKPQEKTSLGGDFNSGVTSRDDVERQEIEKKGSLANIDQREEREK